MGIRRKAREQAIQVLFGLEFNQTNSMRAIRNYYSLFDNEPKVDQYLHKLVEGVVSRQEELNEVIRRHSTNWRLERMAVVDKNILRIAAYELFFEPEVPRKVAINEAIEIAKRYGSEDSPAFVNGVLDRIALEARGEEDASAADKEEVGEDSDPELADEI